MVVESGLEIKRRDQVTWGIVVPCPEFYLYSQRQETDRSSTDVSTEAEEQFYLPAVASVSTRRLLCNHQKFQAISAACFLYFYSDDTAVQRYLHRPFSLASYAIAMWFLQSDSRLPCT